MPLEIKILTDEEFDKLPYPEATYSLGLADTKRGTAYVRYTASDELNKYLIEHELEHLLGEDRDEVHHGGDGVYYKGFGNIFSAIGGAARGAGRSIIGAGQSIGRGVQGLFGGQQAAQASSMGGFGGPASTAMTPKPGLASTMPKGGYAAQAAANPALRIQSSPSSTSTLFNSGVPQPLSDLVRSQNPIVKPQSTGGSMPQNGGALSRSAALNPGAQMPPLMTGPNKTVGNSGPPAPMNGFNPNFATDVASSVASRYQPPMPSVQAPMASPSVPNTRPSPAEGSAGSNVVATAKPGGKPNEGIFGKDVKAGQVLTGAALEGFGQFGMKTPDMPDISELPSVQALKNYNIRNFQELDPALQTAINNDFDRIDTQERDRLIAQYKSLRPGADIESDSSFRRDVMELERMQGQRRADAMAKYRFEFIQQQLNISSQELEQMQYMAEMDINSIMMQMGLDYGEAQAFKDTFSGIGDRMISDGLGFNNTQPQEEEANA